MEVEEISPSMRHVDQWLLVPDIIPKPFPFVIRSRAAMVC